MSTMYSQGSLKERRGGQCGGMWEEFDPTFILKMEEIDHEPRNVGSL